MNVVFKIDQLICLKPPYKVVSNYGLELLPQGQSSRQIQEMKQLVGFIQCGLHLMSVLEFGGY